MNRIIPLLLAMALVAQCLHGEISNDGKTIAAAGLVLSLGQAGEVEGLVDAATGTDYSTEDGGSLVGLLLADGSTMAPVSVGFKDGRYGFRFDGDIVVGVDAQLGQDHIVFEVAEFRNGGNLEIAALFWRVDTRMRGTVAESAGILYNDEFAVGLMGLNTKTCGGWFPYFDPEVKSEKWHSGERQKHQRSAIPTVFGSQLRAYTGNFSRPWVRKVEKIPATEVPALPVELVGDDGQIEGSRIALYGCRRARLLDVMEEIVLSEKLPYPTYGGVWFRRPAGRQEAMRPFFEVGSFLPGEIDGLLYMIRRSGCGFLFGDRPFANFQGDYRIKNFEQDDAAYRKEIADKAARMDVGLGMHSRSSEINRKVPVARGVANIHANLLRIKHAKLLEPLAADACGRLLPVEPFSLAHGSQPTILIDDEAIDLKVEKKGGEYTIAKRGCLDTEPSAHAAGAEVWLLSTTRQHLYGNLDYIFNTMLPRFIELGNGLGVRRLGWDGNLTAYTLGYGHYLLNEVQGRFFRALEDRDGMRFSGAQITPYIWHFTTHRGAGGTAPPGGRFESYSSDALRGLAYHQRNFMPRLLGIPFTKDTTESEAHWIGSKLAAWNAGARFTSSKGSLASNPRKDAIADILRTWIIARDVNAFTLEQRNRMARYDSWWKLVPLEPSISWRLEKHENGTVTGSETVRAPGVVNLAKNAAIQSSSPADFPERINDSSIPLDADATLKGEGLQYVQLDLGRQQTIDQIRFWHRYEDGRRYKDVIVQLSNDAAFSSGVSTIFNNDHDNSAGQGTGSDREYSEPFYGKTVLCPAATARYVRLWSNGSDADHFNHYAEIQVLSGKRTYPAFLDVGAESAPESQLTREEIKELKKKAREEKRARKR